MHYFIHQAGKEPIMFILAATFCAIVVAFNAYMFFEQRHRGHSGSAAATAMIMGASGLIINLTCLLADAIKG